jgi:hypothetical protein
MARATICGPGVVAIWKRRSRNAPRRSATIAPVQGAGQPAVIRQTNPDPSFVGVSPDGTLKTATLTGETVDPAIATHRGRIVKTTGDGVMAEGASAADALTCADAVQEKMGKRSTHRSGVGPKPQFWPPAHSRAVAAPSDHPSLRFIVTPSLTEVAHHAPGREAKFRSAFEGSGRAVMPLRALFTGCGPPTHCFLARIPRELSD